MEKGKRMCIDEIIKQIERFNSNLENMIFCNIKLAFIASNASTLQIIVLILN